MEGIHLASATIHHEEDSGLGLGWKMTRLRSQGIWNYGPRRMPCKESGSGQERGKRYSGKASSHLPDELTSGQSAGVAALLSPSQHTEIRWY